MEFSANIANLGKYNAGNLAAAWQTFPATTEQVQSVLREIGVDGLRYEEIIILEYSIGIKGLAGRLGEFVPIDELNYLASRITELMPEERSKFTAAVSHGEYGDSMQDLINLTYNLDCYEFFPEVRTEEDYGRSVCRRRPDCISTTNPTAGTPTSTRAGTFQTWATSTITGQSSSRFTMDSTSRKNTRCSAIPCKRR